YQDPPPGSPPDAAPRTQLMCFEAVTGNLVWARSWHDRGERSGEQQQQANSANLLRAYQAAHPDKPNTPAEIMLFGDRVSTAMSIIGGVVYTLEGEARPKQLRNNVRGNYGMTFAVETNRLYAWEAGAGETGGKRLWNRGGDLDPETGEEVPVKFVAAPVAHGKRLIVPVRESGALWLYALEPRENPDWPTDGEAQWEVPTVWKTFLCDEPPAGVSPWGRVGVALDGTDVYVAGGAGVAFAVDAVTGIIRWGTRYRRSATGARTGARG
ncbi:unnamed protein product, partial [marine sediment metagenome]